MQKSKKKKNNKKKSGTCHRSFFKGERMDDMNMIETASISDLGLLNQEDKPVGESRNR